MHRYLKLLLIAVALMVPASVALGAYSTGGYAGKTAQKKRITFRAYKTTKLTNIRFTANYSCHDRAGTNTGPATSIATVIPSVRVYRGKVKKLVKLSGGNDQILFTARLIGRRATGTFKERYVAMNNDICATPTVKWSARH